MGRISRKARAAKRRRRRLARVRVATASLCLTALAAGLLAGCPARRPAPPGDELGPPAVLDPTLLDRG